MEKITSLFSNLWEIIKTYDLQKILDLIHSINWLELMNSPVAWLVLIAVLLVIIISKRYRYVLVVLSIAVFIYLVDKTLPAQLENVELKNLIGFFAGTVAIVGINFYFLVVRE